MPTSPPIAVAAASSADVVARGVAAATRLAQLAATLRADGRSADLCVAQPHPLVVTVRSGDRLVVLAPAAAWDQCPEVFKPFDDFVAQSCAAVVLLGTPGRSALDEALNRGLTATVSTNPDADELYVAIHNAVELLEARRRAESRGKWLNRYRYELGELIEIAQALTTETDIDKLLAVILEKSRFITGADAGSLYVVEGDDPDIARRTLHFKLSQNDSIRFDSSEFSMPISPRSMAGYVALNRCRLNIVDVYELPPEAPYYHDKSFDKSTGYRTQSMLCTPLLSHLGDVLGVIQLINKKDEPQLKLRTPEDFERHVIAFDQRSEEVLSTLASQAGIALSNAILYSENQAMLEGFVRASVEAIEQRDPTTSGHSRRVAELSVGLAECVERCTTGTYSSVSWDPDDLRELEYASLLHDFGKIGVREHVLVKAKKLYPHELELIHARFGQALYSCEVDLLRRQLSAARRGASEEDLRALEQELSGRQTQLEEALAAIVSSNEPSVLKSGDFELLEAIARETYVDRQGAPQPLLTESNVLSLSIPRGSLTPAEFDEIRSHVVHTFQFLSRIPWGRQFRRVAAIAGSHHERLDGTGYPDRLRSSEIPLQSKIMAVSDIFDALTAADRPYKKAVPLSRALDILRMEVEQGHIDSDLVGIFGESQVWQRLPDPPRD